MFGGGIHKLHSYLNLQDVVFTFLVPSTAHCYRKLVFFFLKKKKKKKPNTSFTLCLLEATSKGKNPQPKQQTQKALLLD